MNLNPTQHEIIIELQAECEKLKAENAKLVATLSDCRAVIIWLQNNAVVAPPKDAAMCRDAAEELWRKLEHPGQALRDLLAPTIELLDHLNTPSHRRRSNEELFIEIETELTRLRGIVGGDK